VENPSDEVCYWDLTFRDRDRQERDTSAAAIATCGLLELSGLLAHDDPDRDRLHGAALSMLETLTSKYLSTDPDEDGLLRQGVCHRPQGHGVNECCLWGDYFFMEALVRQDPMWSSFW
jgi:unsaturated chondroitin disaccharide hydrolase